MFTKKSLILVATLMLALVCAGTISTFAATATSATRAVKHATTHYQDTKIAAIPAISKDGSGLLSPLNVRKYLNNQGFIGGPTLNGQAPIIQDLRLTNLFDLRNLDHIFVPGVSDNRQVFFARLLGPFELGSDLSPSVLSTLIPSQNTLFLLSGLNDLPLLSNLGTLGNLSILSDVGNCNVLHCSTSCNEVNCVIVNGRVVDCNRENCLGLTHVLENVFEIFDAKNGDLLGWG